jgi:hypothetical protein
VALALTSALWFSPIGVRSTGAAKRQAACTIFVLRALLLFAAFLGALPLAAQTFKNPTLISTATDPTTISQADLNGDGKIDLAYLDGGGPFVLHVLLGNGDGTFQRGQNIQLPLGIGGTITIADVNKDGKPDLVLGGGGPQGQIGVLLGNGDGTFAAPVISTFPPGGINFASIGSVIGVADFNGDGAVDLAASDGQNDAVYILLGNNTGSFTLKTTLFNGGAPENVLTADLNGDGHIDLVVRGSLGADATVYLGNGDGTFQNGVGYAGPHNITSVMLRDMDGDGHLDMVVTGFNNTIDILHGNGDGTFATTSSGGTANGGPLPLLLAIADFNSDGILDFATATENGICMQLGKGNLAYGPPIPYSGSPSPNSAVMADFNRDGFEDFAEVAPGGIALIFGAAGGTLQSADVYDLGEGAANLAVADFNSDSNPDIAVNTTQPAPVILLGKGSGKFTVPALPGPPTNQPAGISIYTGDFNGDGKADLLLTNGSPNPSATIFFGDGNGTFSAPVVPTISATPSTGVAVLGDFNHDGTTDIGVFDDQSLDILLGERTNTFNVESNFFPGLASSNGAAVGDLNNDGKLDIVFTQDSSNPLQILLGNGDGTFSLGHQLPANIFPQVMAAADLDGDGNSDIVALEGFASLAQIYYGNGDGTFQNPVTLPLERQYLQMQVVDIDHDGKPDLVFTDNKLICIIRNLGNRNFGSEEHILAGSIGSFMVADVNGDGLPDILVANGGTGTGVTPTTVTVLLNQGAAKTISGQLSVSPEPSTYGQPFTITLAITPQGANPPAPTGNVAISIDDVPVANVPVTGLNLSYTYPDSPPLSVGVHTLEATYSGDKNYIAATFTDQHEIVPILYPTTTTLTATPATAAAGSTVRFTATVTSPGQNANAPNPLSGTVVFRDGSTNLGTAQVGNGGVAIFDTALLSTGTHNIVAYYLGYTAQFEQTASFAASNSASTTITITASATSTALTGIPTSVTAGSVVSLTAVVTSTSGIPTGAVTFSDGSTALSNQPLDATGTAVFGATFGSSGTHTLTAAYRANSSFAGSTSAQLPITVTGGQQAAESVTQLSAVPNSQVPTQLVLTANVSAQSTVPTGLVSFVDGNSELGAVPLNSRGEASYPLTAAPGLHYFIAIYAGDSKHRSSVSAAVLERMPLNDSDFSLNLAARSLTIPQGQSITTLATVTSINGFNGMISISCSTESPNVSCQVPRSALSGGRGSSLIVIRAVQSRVGASMHVGLATFPGAALKGTLFVCVIALTVLLIPSIKRRRLALASICILCAVRGAGCAGPSPVSKDLTPVGSYTLTIQASSASTKGAASLSHTTQLQVQVVAGSVN